MDPGESSPENTHGVWATLREAITGTQADLTSIPLKRAVALLAVPTILEMSMESLLTVVDIYFVSKLGSNAVATIGLTESVLSIVHAMAMGLSAGATAMVSRRIGEKDPDGAAEVAVQVIFAAMGLAALLGLIGALSAPWLLGAMGASPGVIAEGSGYTRLMLGGNASIFLLFVINAIFRGAGDAAIAMRSLWLANLLNMALAPIFIFGLGPIPALGVTGAALAATIGRGTGVVYQIARLRQRGGVLRVEARHLRMKLPLAQELFKISTPAALQVMVETASWLGLVRIVASFGSQALAGYTIAMRVAIFTVLPSWGMAGATAALVGQNLGAKKIERAQRTVVTVASANAVFLGIVGAVLAVIPMPIVALLTSDPEVASFAATCLRIVGASFLFFGYGLVVIQAFNGAGDTSTPLALNAACFWLFKIPLAYLLAIRGGLGPQGVFIAIALAYSLQAIGGWALFRRGRWKLPTPDGASI